MSAQHTPGPWRWWPCKDGSYDSNNDYIQISAGEQLVAKVNIRSVTEPDMRLIAAAPDLLEVLELCEGNISSLLASAHPRVYGEWLTVVRAAIAKAKGEAK